MPFAETGGIGQIRLRGKNKEFDFDFEVLVEYPGGAVQQTLGNMSLRLVWKQIWKDS